MIHRGIAPMCGTSSIYTHLSGNQVLIMKEGYDYRVIPERTFYQLFYELSDTKAALKEDCIEFAIYRRYTPPYEYPNWYVEAMVDGLIYEDGLGFGGYMFYDHSGEIAMADGAFILKNFKDELRYMEANDFLKYYELIGG